MIWYETDEDLRNEEALMTAYLRRINRDHYTLEKMPVDLILDYALINPAGKVCAVFEVKHRRKAYHSVILSFNKIKMCRNFEEEGIPAFFLISMPDRDGAPRLYCYRVGTTSLGYRWGGRNSRDKREPLADIPLSGFDDMGPL